MSKVFLYLPRSNLSSRDSICIDLKLDPLTTRRTGVIEYLEKKLKQPSQPDIEVSSVPKKQAIFAFILLIIGIAMLVMGIVIAVSKGNGSKSIGFWIIAGICLLPGGYYTIKYVLLYRRIKTKKVNKVLAIPQI